MPSAATLPSLSSMKRLAPFLLAAALLANTSCHVFSWKKKPAAPKESSKVATEVEKDFMARWVDKRTADLVAQGKSQESAREQAAAEFKDKFGYTDAARQAR